MAIVIIVVLVVVMVWMSRSRKNQVDIVDYGEHKSTYIQMCIWSNTHLCNSINQILQYMLHYIGKMCKYAILMIFTIFSLLMAKSNDKLILWIHLFMVNTIVQVSTPYIHHCIHT